MSNTKRTGLGILVVAALGAGAFATAYSSGRGGLAATLPAAENFARAWLAAVANDRPDEAIMLARALTENEPSALDARAYAFFAEKLRIDTAAFVKGFDFLDYACWRHAYLFEREARKIVGDAADAPRALFAAVTARMRAPDPDLRTTRWPWQLWEAGRGDYDKQAWVLGEFLYQLGWESLLVSLRAAETGLATHTALEARRGDVVIFFDPREKKMRNRPAHRSAADPAEPVEPALREALRYALYLLPVDFRDMRPPNRKLQAVLRKHLGEETPRFGEDPARRRDACRRSPDDDTAAVGFWTYPTDLYRLEMQIEDNLLKRTENR